MTKNEKEALIKRLNTVLDTCYAYDPHSLSTPSIPAWAKVDVESVIHNFGEEETEYDTKASLNYEGEYKRLLEQVSKLEEELNHWKRTAEAEQIENHDLQTVIATFEFIYGRELNL